MDNSEIRAVALANRELHLLGLVDEGIDSVPTEGTWLLEKGERVAPASEWRRLKMMNNAEMDDLSIPRSVIVMVTSKASRMSLQDFGDFKRLTLTMFDGEEFQYDSHDCGFDFDSTVALLMEASK